MSDKPILDFAEIGRRLLHPTQRGILEHMHKLKGKSISPVELAGELDQALGNVSYHVRVLTGQDGGKFADHPLLELVSTRPRRGAVEHFYALVAYALVA
jgi:hypothetical protein